MGVEGHQSGGTRDVQHGGFRGDQPGYNDIMLATESLELSIYKAEPSMNECGTCNGMEGGICCDHRNWYGEEMKRCDL